MFFELHVTINNGGPLCEEGWREWCVGNGIKPLLIKLTQGNHDTQLMCAWQFQTNDVESAHVAAEQLEYDVNRHFVVERVKLEGALHQWDPKDDYTYAETHLKCLVTPEQRESLVSATPDGYGVSESLWGAPKGLHKMFITHRIYPDWWPAEPRSKYPAHIRDEFAYDFSLFEPVVSLYENEIVYADTNPSVDDGWFDSTLNGKPSHY